MIFKKLYLQDFGVFGGGFERNTIDLQPREKDGSLRPIILFGGLNGAGKTTTLTAVRLALYGRQSLGKAITTTRYHDFLADSVHKSRNQLLAPNTAAVQLDFDFGRRGEVIDYTIKRSWSKNGNNIIELLEIYQNGELIKGLTDEQKQSFLNELIPIGVADLFFFDGEKIAELAEDDNNAVLADAIDRLLGIDIINRLKADLSVYLRNQKKDKMPEDVQTQINVFEAIYKKQYGLYQEALSNLETKKIVHTDLMAKKERQLQTVNELGGAWASSRQSEEAKEIKLREEKINLINQIKALLADASPLSLAKVQIQALMQQLKAEQQAKKERLVEDELNSRIEAIKKSLLSSLGNDYKEEIESSFTAQKIQPSSAVEIIHDISDSEFNRLQHIIDNVVPKQQEELKTLSSRLEKIEGELEAIGINISRAPDEKRIESYVAELSETNKQIGAIETELEQHKKEAKNALKLAMDALRKLRDHEKQYNVSSSVTKGISLAENTRGLLSQFAAQTRKRRIATLEKEFLKSFSKLARKDDLLIKARINSETYSVTLLDNNGNAVEKQKLSAGEKQIFAIAMLEALGRTSGKALPIIIDTPLGRLDSKHRKNLVRNYFPTASHQVLILSTDTEVDEDFYQELAPDISHAFEVTYDPEAGCSSYNEGYFWRS
ncbi:DNA sulfur modification protein DndD [Marinomonas balearica]|uniref:DNA sulfur modification protein DndD n=1 Tax=Marinomonas balearica TaxID=491947 RepID=A0A4R6M984_9GAMM|nr:DNA sulfur modification protein DndD [Marinomonas balearica]TDO96729.1 DNA sulfur modification protein DndD [Marinomonas balearica]